MGFFKHFIQQRLSSWARQALFDALQALIVFSENITKYTVKTTLIGFSDFVY
jgi:hypothetical protein